MSQAMLLSLWVSRRRADRLGGGRRGRRKHRPVEGVVADSRQPWVDDRWGAAFRRVPEHPPGEASSRQRTRIPRQRNGSRADQESDVSTTS
jgi:hypothetical protein